MDNKENLTHLQYIALEGEVGYALITSAHKDEMLFRIYLLFRELHKKGKKYKPYMVKAIKDNVDLEEEEIERILLEAESENPPLWMWINRTMSDIKAVISCGELVGMPKELRLPVKRDVLKKKLATSAFINFIKKISLVCSDAAKALVEAILTDDDLSFLHLASFALLGEIAELQKFKKSKPVTEDFLVEASFDSRDFLSFIAEKKAIEEPINDIKGILDALEEEKPEEQKTEIVEYEVVKVFQDSGVSTTLRKFATKEEAVAFVEDIKTKYPEALKNTPIIIVKKEMR